MNIKRILALGAMIFGVGLLGASPAFALVNPPAPPAGCTQVTAGAAVWPKGSHSYYCGTASSANGALMQAPLNTASNMGKTFTEMKNLAGGTVASNRGNFYLFHNPAEYAAAFPGYPVVVSPTSPGFTYNDTSTGNAVPVFTVIFEQTAGGQPVIFIGNTAAHEFGHWVDSLESAVLTGNEVIRLNGTVTVGHTISLTVTAGDISGGSATVSAVSVAGDTLTTMATKLAAAAMAEPKLTTKGYTTTASGSSLTVNYVGTGGPTYSYSVTGAGAITEQVWLDAGAKASAHALIVHSLHGNPANTNGDIFTFNGKNACLNNNGVFSRQMDVNERFICATATDAAMTGAITPGHNLTLTITDPEVNGGAGVPVVVPVVAGDTTATLATKFKNAINGNGTLSAKFITATSAGSHFLISSGTGNDTNYVFSNGGGTENMILTWQGDGKDSVLSRLHYPLVNSNWSNLQLAWPGPGSIFTDDDETFAETFAAQLGGYTDRSFPGGGGINIQSQDWYLQQAPGFRCTWYVIREAGQSRVKPTSAFPAGCPST